MRPAEGSSGGLAGWLDISEPTPEFAFAVELRGINVELNLWLYGLKMMTSKIMTKLITACKTGDEIASPCGRAIVEERYETLQRQIPIIYLLAIVNFSGLELATGGRLTVGLNFPTLLAACAAIRVAHWCRPPAEVGPALMLRRLKQTHWLTGVICLLLCMRCLYLLRTLDASFDVAVILFGGLTAIGAAYGLSAHSTASRTPLLVLALPLAAMAIVSSNAMFVGAALSLAVVALLILRLLNVHNTHFTELIRSRSTIAHEQELAEHARRDALVAARTDFLTALPNRRAFIAAIDEKIAAAGSAFAIAIVDLDRFKSINDTFGHASGDDVLKTVAARLQQAADEQTVVARLGGDEFGLLFPALSDAIQAQAVGASLMREVNQLANIRGRKLPVSACCGLAVSPPALGKTASSVLAHADLALYHAKENGSGHVSVFEAAMEGPYRRRAKIEAALQLSAVHRRIHLLFQPIIDLQSGHLLAHEALARWNDPELGAVSPSEFVPLAEQLNIIGDISNTLMLKAFAEAASWPDSVRLSFNLSAVQLCSTGSAEAIVSALRTAGIGAGRLQVEVTETSLLSDFGTARDNLEKLRAEGALIVLDDFGAGYASIGYLRELRFDQIKLDGSLVTAAQDSAEGERLLGSVICLCNALGVWTVAEHIESERQLQLLVKLGCRAGQGHFFQRPMPAEAARHFAQSAHLLGSAGASSVAPWLSTVAAS